MGEMAMIQESLAIGGMRLFGAGFWRLTAQSLPCNDFHQLMISLCPMISCDDERECSLRRA